MAGLGFSFNMISKHQYFIDGKRVDVVDQTSKTRPMVSITMITYNHERYISQAIEAVMMQKTNFSIKLIIGDDFSSDTTREIISKFQIQYSDKIVLKLPECNLGVNVNSLSNKLLCNGKYIAECEGDDYWTDPLKLQKQVDFLEKNPSYVMTCHSIYEFKNDFLHKTDWRCNKSRIKYRLEDYLYKLFFHTSSVVYQNHVLPAYLGSTKVLNGDYALYLYILTKGKLYYFNERMSVYRVHDGGITNSALHKEKQKVFESKNYIFENLNAITNFEYSKYIRLNFLIEKEILFMNSRKSSLNKNRFKYWFYKLNYKFLLLIKK